MSSFVQVSLHSLPADSKIKLRLRIGGLAAWNAKFPTSSGIIERDQLSPEDSLTFEIGKVSDFRDGPIQFGEIRLANVTDDPLPFQITVEWMHNDAIRGEWAQPGILPANQLTWPYFIGAKFNG